MGHRIEMVQQAYRFALEPTPKQARMFASHVGGARFAFNWGLARVGEAMDARAAEVEATGEASTDLPGHFDLCKMWTEWKNTAEWTDRATGEVSQGVSWVGNNFVGTYQAALRDADRAWKNFFSSLSGDRKGRAVRRPRFKGKGKSREAFQVHGDALRLVSATRVMMPKVGAVVVMSDDSRHPAMSRSRRRAPGQRHMGNRRRSRQLWEELRVAQRRAVTAVELLAAARGATDPERVVESLNVIVDRRSSASAVAKAQERIVKAEKVLAGAKDEAATVKAEKRLKSLRAALEGAASRQANRTERWTEKKLAAAEASGRLSAQQAEDLCAVHGLDGAEREALCSAANQARVVRGNVSLGADGLWWLSLTCEVPVQVRTAPTRRQRANGAAGVDFGVRELARISGRPDRIRNPRYLQKALGELRWAQQRLSRCEPGSARRAKAKRRVGIIHADVARLRDAAAHRATTNLARRYESLAVEGWNVQQLMGSGKDLPRKVRRNRNRALADAGVGAARWQLTYKTSRAGSSLTITGPGEPTGRTCAACGQVKTKPVQPYHEVFSCESCGRSRPRRVNTALVLAKVAAESGSLHGGSDQTRGEDVSPSALPRGGLSSLNREARSRPSGRGETGTPGP